MPPMVPGLCVDLRERVLNTPRFFVRPLMNQNIENIRNCYDSCSHRDSVTFQPGIATTIPTLMVTERNYPRLSWGILQDNREIPDTLKVTVYGPSLHAEPTIAVLRRCPSLVMG
jgi:hypothetical protein